MRYNPANHGDRVSIWLSSVSTSRDLLVIVTELQRGPCRAEFASRTARKVILRCLSVRQAFLGVLCLAFLYWLK
jgi:hypothetical protein